MALNNQSNATDEITLGTANTVISGSGPAYYFFDVTNISNGDTVTLSLTNVGAPPTNTINFEYAGLTFDTIPEPTSLALLGLGGLILLPRRRRSANA